MRRSGRRFSRLARISCSCAAILLLAGTLSAVMPEAAGARLVVQSSPFVALGSAIALRAIGIGTGIGLLFALPALFRRRWYCHYFCPTGLLLDEASRASPRRRKRPWANWPPLGRHAALVTLAGAIPGYPLLLWLDPMALIAGLFAIPGSTGLRSGILSGALLGVILVACLALGNVWCARLCPLGGMQDFLIAGRVAAGRLLRRLNRADDLPAIPARRALLAGLLGVALALLGRRTGQARAGTAPLRPPGARAEAEFTGLCIRCGNCSSVCPTRIIEPDPGRAGVAGLLAPRLRFDGDGYCRENCAACTQACPSGALTALDLDAKHRYIIGEALVDADRCLLVLGRKECDACAIACPYDAVNIVWDEAQYLAYPLVDYQRCNGCGACQIACPTEEVKAIVVWPSLPDPAVGDDHGLPRYLPPHGARSASTG